MVVDHQPGDPGDGPVVAGVRDRHRRPVGEQQARAGGPFADGAAPGVVVQVDTFVVVQAQGDGVEDVRGDIAGAALFQRV
ncbi:hypothetical protein [Nonomuraea sp. SBT364]|uniref:hypothetical protein n=1 Tax=Nonomuraea sp. SBT364 TaxID=1580530 RepID=UPI00066D3ED0|nr:hypothetical protein [Nonomuraea sp. SBT364]